MVCVLSDLLKDKDKKSIPDQFSNRNKEGT